MAGPYEYNPNFNSGWWSDKTLPEQMLLKEEENKRLMISNAIAKARKYNPSFSRLTDEEVLLILLARSKFGITDEPRHPTPTLSASPVKISNMSDKEKAIKDALLAAIRLKTDPNLSTADISDLVRQINNNPYLTEYLAFTNIYNRFGAPPGYLLKSPYQLALNPNQALAEINYMMSDLPLGTSSLMAGTIIPGAGITNAVTNGFKNGTNLVSKIGQGALLGGKAFINSAKKPLSPTALKFARVPVTRAGNFTGYTTASTSTLPLTFTSPFTTIRTAVGSLPLLLKMGALLTTATLLNEAGNGLGLWNTPAFLNRFAVESSETPTEESTTTSEASTASESSTPTPEPNNNDNNKNDKRTWRQKLKDARDAYRGKGNLSQPTPQEPHNKWTRWIHATKNNAPTWKTWQRWGYNIIMSPVTRTGEYLGGLAIDDAADRIFGINTNISDFVFDSYPHIMATRQFIKKLEEKNKKEQDNKSGDSSTGSTTIPSRSLINSIGELEVDSLLRVLDEYYDNSNFR